MHILRLTLLSAIALLCLSPALPANVQEEAKPAPPAQPDVRSLKSNWWA